MTHMAVNQLLDPLKELPTNIVKGFDQVLKFAYLEQDSKDVKAACASALLQCNITASMVCPTSKFPSPAATSQLASMNASVPKIEILKSFDNSLTLVRKVASDKYFGTAGLKTTAESLNNITSELKQMNNTMQCFKATPIFCTIFKSSDNIVDGMSQVSNAINDFKTNDIIEQWGERGDLLIFLHALPYFLVLSLLFFAFFIWKGGVCCCCRSGTFVGTLALVPFAIFWLLAFGIYMIVCAIGFVMKFASDRIDVPGLHEKGTLDDVISHIQSSYPEFWNVVFADMEHGLDVLFKASLFFVVACLLIAVYAGCECCCCPYRKKLEAKQGSLRA